MSDLDVSFYGSKSDLSDLREFLTKAGFQEVRDETVRATDAIHGVVIPLSMVFIVHSIPEISKCVQVYLKERGKRMVKRDGSNFIIKGNFTSKEFGEIVETCGRLTIEDDKHDT